MQLAMANQAKDAREFGLKDDNGYHPTWSELVELDAHDSYIRDAEFNLRALETLGVVTPFGGDDRV